MRLQGRMQEALTVATTLALLAVVSGVPLPAEPTEDNLVEVHEEGLLVLVPTVPMDEKEKDGKDLKREVEYELISIPKEALQREIRQVASHYSAPSDSAEDNDGLVITSQISSNPSYEAPQVTLTKSVTATLPQPPSITITKDFGKVLTGATQQAASVVGGVGQALKSVGQGASQVLAEVVPAAAAGGAQAARWLVDNKAEGIRTAAQVASEGFQYAGQLSAAVLRVLLQVPSIKARVLSEVIRASQPLSYAVSDVLAESADDLGDIFAAKNDILKDALDIFIRLIQDTLAIKGRIIAKLGASGLDVGATAFNAGMRVGGAFVESAGGIATAVGTGVGDLVRVASTADFPPPPQLPAITLPQLPILNIPKIIPSLDLTALIPTQTTLEPLPLPTKPPPAPISITTVSKPSPSYGVPKAPSPSYAPPTTPSQSYGPPGR
ncbi:uncharacterized protein [Panulirus ornatus]|uniref:uncharacterized protein isoform X2 n=1 Tax=Panulirus ornatus TaxID=150431 RepID=UPI003A8C2E17